MQGFLHQHYNEANYKESIRSVGFHLATIQIPKNPSHILIMYLTYAVKTQVFAGRTKTSLPLFGTSCQTTNLLLPAAIEDSIAVKTARSNQPSTLEP